MSDQGQVSSSLFYTDTEAGVPITLLRESGGSRQRIARDVEYDRTTRLQVESSSNRHTPMSPLSDSDAIPLGIKHRHMNQEPFRFREMRYDLKAKHERNIYLPEALMEAPDAMMDTINPPNTSTSNFIRFQQSMATERPIYVATDYYPQNNLRGRYDQQLLPVLQAIANYHPQVGQATSFQTLLVNDTPFVDVVERLRGFMQQCFAAEQQVFLNDDRLSMVALGFLLNQRVKINTSLKPEDYVDVVNTFLSSMPPNPSRTGAFFALALMPMVPPSLIPLVSASVRGYHAVLTQTANR